VLFTGKATGSNYPPASGHVFFKKEAADEERDRGPLLQRGTLSARSAADRRSRERTNRTSYGSTRITVRAWESKPKLTGMLLIFKEQERAGTCPALMSRRDRQRRFFQSRSISA
jgi:hypothetical protein